MMLGVNRLPGDWQEMLRLLALPEGEQLKGASGADFWTAPLGLKSSYKKVRSGSDGLVDEFRDYRFNGVRHGREVRVRPSYPRNRGRWDWGAGAATDSEVTVQCAAPVFRTEDLDLVEGPPEVERALREIEGARRWKRTEIDSDGKRIRVHRRMRMLTTGQWDWTYDLWLAEELARRLGG